MTSNKLEKLLRLVGWISWRYSACFLSTTIFTWYKWLHALAQIVYYHQTVAHSEDGQMYASMYWVLRGWATLW